MVKSKNIFAITFQLMQTKPEEDYHFPGFFLCTKLEMFKDLNSEKMFFLKFSSFLGEQELFLTT